MDICLETQGSGSYWGCVEQVGVVKVDHAFLIMLNVLGQVALNIGLAHWAQGAITPARQAFTRALQLCQRLDEPFGAVLAECMLADLDLQPAQLYRAGRRYRNAIQLVDRSDGLRSPAGSAPAIGLSMMYYEWNDLPQARRWVEDGLACSINGGRVDVVVMGRIMLARLHQPGERLG